jgi:hypothetical protein
MNEEIVAQSTTPNTCVTPFALLQSLDFGLFFARTAGTLPVGEDAEMESSVRVFVAFWGLFLGAFNARRRVFVTVANTLLATANFLSGRESFISCCAMASVGRRILIA